LDQRLGSSKTKVLLLHGGAAMTHGYLEAMESFLPDAGIEMYYYDQLGCWNSDIPEDTSLWTPERYTEEVEEVRRGMGLENFVLYGQSWGRHTGDLNMRSGALVQAISAGSMRSWRKIDLHRKDSVPESERSLVFEA
jgi:proline-specific peptidase